MRLSTVGRYALRAMVDLALHNDQGPIQRIDIAERQDVSDQYLAQLFVKLRRAGLVQSVRGPGGGYMLARDPGQISASDVLRAVEETLEPVFCVDDEAKTHCPRVDSCPTHWLWAELSSAINEVLDSVTLTELCQHTSPSTEAVGESGIG
ncbi:MAG: RrF2 family transcriptional regulator [Anaerolineae bacterium]|nr:RrF2 family transcriptional regulator [Anaerolineae bacterium]